MSLRRSLKTDLAAATGGVWINLTAYPNPDGTVPGFLVSRQSISTNPAFASAMQDLGTRERPADEQVDMAATLKADTEVFVNGILMSWRNFEPDEDGVKVDYSKKEAERVFGDAAWSDLKSRLVQESADESNYTVLQRELAAKNSSASSPSTSTEEQGTKT